MQNQPFFNRLYVRIWVAVVVAVAVLILLVGLAWRESAERKSAEFSSTLLVRELIIKNAAGDEIGRAKASNAVCSSYKRKASCLNFASTRYRLQFRLNRMGHTF